MLIIGLLRGSKNNPSIAGIKRCGIVDWILLAVFIILCALVATFSII
jgi:hypothetical protein